MVPNGMTVAEGRAAYDFLSGVVKNTEGYNAGKKLLKFIESLTANDNRYKHIPLFLEKEDCADVSKERMPLTISGVSAKLYEYAQKNHLIQESAKSNPDEVQSKPMTEAELWEMIKRTGVA
jgi:hypothetical protein